MKIPKFLKSRGSLVASAIALAMVFPLVNPAQAQKRPARLRIALNGFENNITPFTVSFGAAPNTHDLLNLVFDSLFWSQATDNPEPWLADSATATPDFKKWTVKLHPGVLWHDGVPFTAEDVKFSFEYYLKQVGASGRYAHHVSDTPPFDHAEVVDPLTVNIFYKAPAPTFKILPGADLPIIAKHQWENIAEPAKATTMLPIGTGPFKLTEIKTDERYVMTANDSYFKGRPTVGELELVVVPQPLAAFGALLSGEVDMVTRNIQPELAKQIEANSSLRIQKGSKYESTQIFFNTRQVPLNDAKVRKAISLAIDNDELVDTVLLGRGRPGVDNFIHPDSPWALPGATHEFDVAKANRLLEDGGYSLKGDNIRRTADGKKLEFNVLVSSFETSDIRALQLISRMVERVGIRLNPELLDPVTIRQRRNATPPNFDAYISVLETHAHVDPDSLYYFFHTPGTKGFGGAISGYSNAKFDALVESATVLDLKDRKAVLADAEKFLAQEVPVITLYYRNGEYVFKSGAYDGWLSDPGHGIFTKRSFIPRAATPVATTSAGATTSGSAATTAPASTQPATTAATVAPTTAAKSTVPSAALKKKATVRAKAKAKVKVKA